jgi:hypothetical protein
MGYRSVPVKFVCGTVFPMLWRRGALGPAGMAWRAVKDEGVCHAIFSMSGKKAPEPDGIGASVIRLLWDWDSANVTMLIQSAIRLGAHPRSWKIDKGVTILKPGKLSYSTVKSCTVMSLLNCMGKVTEKVITEMLSEHCKKEGGSLNKGQYGCHKGRSTIDAVGMLTANIQEA